MAVTTTRRRGIIKNRGGWDWECLGQNSFSRHIFAKYFSFIVLLCFFHSRSREFLGMIASDSHSRIVGMDFFHSLPVPELWEWIFFIPFPFPNFGNVFFFIPFPFPNWGNGFFRFPSRSRTLGMELSIPVPVPELPNVIPAHPWFIPVISIFNIIMKHTIMIIIIFAKITFQK